MKITKLGHCCLLIEEKGLRILTDPGAYSTSQNNVENIDVILITHEHPDHLHVQSLKNCLENNPGAKIITNKGVGRILDKEGIDYELVEHNQKVHIQEVVIEGYGEKHASIYKTIPSVENTGYFISNKLFYPGDALHNPGKSVDILALPVAGPWLTIGEAIDYALEIHPRVAFPVHDGMLQGDRLGPVHRVPHDILNSRGIKFIVLEEEKEIDL